MMYLTIKDLTKLTSEGFIKLEDSRLEITGDLYAYVSTVGVLGGCLAIPSTEITFDLGKRKKSLKYDLCDILETWHKGNGKKVKITVEVLD